jgi:hypothetical protein
MMSSPKFLSLVEPVELERLVPKDADATKSLRDGITPARNSRAKLALMQTKHRSPKSCRTNHKTTKNAMKKWREGGNLQLIIIFRSWTKFV